MMNQKIITIVKDFSKKPYGRYFADGDSSGEEFRKKILAPALKQFDQVIVDLTGYNRYGRSFIDEAFGGLIRDENFSKPELDRKLKYIHQDLPSIELLIKERIEAAEQHAGK
ncbi:STAS-like domain-containing protein [Morganella morganii]|uniref:STAS-like domain-containing protein n=1 Tax=Morganella morganii TaxID=582 RepID=UPI002245A4BB|nr:STAS-like domain-containing protein [Morganella morganii]MCW9737686.1 STAS-like domain-containing protein [Morganella morganii]